MKALELSTDTGVRFSVSGTSITISRTQGLTFEHHAVSISYDDFLELEEFIKQCQVLNLFRPFVPEAKNARH